MIFKIVFYTFLLTVSLNSFAENRKHDHLPFSKLLSLAESGKLDAQRSLAHRYDKGKNHRHFPQYRIRNIGVAKNQLKATYWYRKAADAGDPIAMYQLGFRYYIGDGVPKSQKKAFGWFYKSAQKGYVKAIKDVSFMYSRGEGVAKSSALSKIWANKLKSKNNNNKPDSKRIVHGNNPNNNYHSHGGRKHNHPLPKQGIRHRHGSGAYGVSASNNMLTSNKSHTGKQTTSTSTSTSTSTDKNNIIITHGKNKISLDSKYVLRDQHGCLHYNEKRNDYKKGYSSLRKSDVLSVVWHGRCKGGYPHGKGKRMWYVNGKLKGSYTQHFKHRTISDQRTQLYNLGVRIHNNKIRDRKVAKEEKIRKEKKRIVDRDLIRFVKNYNFNSLVNNNKVSASWSPNDKSKAGVNGKGRLTLYLKRSHEANAKINGNFQNGRLIGRAEIKIYASKCYKSGWVFCKVSEDDTSTRTITSSSNIKKLVNTAIDNMLPGMYSRASRKISKLNNSTSSYSSSSSYNSSPSSSSSSTSSNSKSSKSYQCSFRCKGGGDENKVTVSARSNSEAQRKSHSYARKVCGYDRVLSQWGSGSTSCR